MFIPPSGEGKYSYTQRPFPTCGVVFSDLHVVCCAAGRALQVECIVCEGQVVSCGAVQVPLTVGVVRVVGAREARALDGAAPAHIGTSTGSCGGNSGNNKCYKHRA